MKNSRQYFSKLLGPEVGDDVRSIFCPNDIRANLSCSIGKDIISHKKFADTEMLSKLANESRARLATYHEEFSVLSEKVNADKEGNNSLRSKAALESTPFFIATQYLMHSVSGNWNNESRYAMSALKIHAIDMGVGQPRASRINRYHEVLRDLSIADAGSDLLHTAEDSRISEGAFSMAANMMILSHFPESLTGEILGVNLYLRHCDILPNFKFIAARSSFSDRLFSLGVNPSNGNKGLCELSEKAVLEYFEEKRIEGMKAVCCGYTWARQKTESFNENILNILTRWLDPREAARHFVNRRKPEACLYHEHAKINKVSMQKLLNSDDEQSFLEQLAASSLVRAGNPDSSPLLNGLISAHGKMFRIFNRDDILILRRWIANLPYDSAPLQPAAHLIWKDEGVFPEGTGNGGSAPNCAIFKKARQAYPRLLHTELSYHEQEYTRKYISQWLSSASRAVEKGICTLPHKWEPGGLRKWLHDQHEISNSHADDQYETQSREEVVADVLSLAPLTMIDGAWLTGFSHPAIASSDSGYTLFETLFDELGNGVYKQNHPVIYRELLKAVYGDFPDISDPSYAGSQFFGNKDFELPVFWLSIGRYPQTYEPEILGLNLAMEISGVGGGYRRTHKALSKYGYPTMFVDLHNSIDNIATGHSAWAVSSIDTYMSDLPKTIRAKYWARVRTGFVALNPVRNLTVISKIRKKVRYFL
ncbi:iron-containing redox enzyme family protein [Halomonas sp. ISL-60]|uniref:iron-containing redox enzyme family protein n=1 Tax=Halomonas sp. ISL-56 TaxID=2819149 RepID=UPI001BEB9233|nr:iron-containing redox enzyme family protein [Halomonas sp. ISL-56]MBT2772736.1 iron-containing redox enzyme family protein [Halomonas sp. ISL-60]MBT2800531.1 iron-containing redox enzyme family protein [Halomonas sp. ISL-56]